MAVRVLPHAIRFQETTLAWAVFDQGDVAAHAVYAELANELDGRSSMSEPVRQKHAGTVVQGIASAVGHKMDAADAILTEVSDCLSWR